MFALWQTYTPVAPEQHIHTTARSVQVFPGSSVYMFHHSKSTLDNVGAHAITKEQDIDSDTLPDYPLTEYMHPSTSVMCRDAALGAFADTCLLRLALHELELHVRAFCQWHLVSSLAAFQPHERRY